MDFHAVEQLKQIEQVRCASLSLNAARFEMKPDRIHCAFVNRDACVCLRPFWSPHGHPFWRPSPVDAFCLAGVLLSFISLTCPRVLIPAVPDSAMTSSFQSFLLSNAIRLATKRSSKSPWPAPSQQRYLALHTNLVPACFSMICLYWSDSAALHSVICCAVILHFFQLMFVCLLLAPHRCVFCGSMF